MRYEVEFNVVDGDGNVVHECLLEYDNGPIPRAGEKVYWERIWYRVVEVQHQPRPPIYLVTLRSLRPRHRTHHRDQRCPSVIRG